MIHITILLKGLTINNGSVSTKDIQSTTKFDMANVYEVNYYIFFHCY